MTATKVAPRDFDLFLGGGTHVRRRHDGAQPSRGGDRLQAGDAHAHDQHARRRDGARRRHHHRHGAAEGGRRIDHRLVAGEIGLAGQHVHRLRAGDARNEFHGEGLDALRRQLSDRVFLRVRSEKGRQHGALFHFCDFAVVRSAHFEHDVGIGERRARIGRDHGAGRRIVGIGHARGGTGTRLDDDVEAQPLQLLDGLQASPPRGSRPHDVL